MRKIDKPLTTYILLFNIFISFLYKNNLYSFETFNKYTLINNVKRNDIKSLIKNLKLKRYNVNILDNNGNSALYYSIKNNNYETTKLLLKNGASPKIKNSQNEPIYCNALKSSNPKIKKEFEKYDTNECKKKVAIIFNICYKFIDNFLDYHMKKKKAYNV